MINKMQFFYFQLSQDDNIMSKKETEPRKTTEQEALETTLGQLAKKSKEHPLRTMAYAALIGFTLPFFPVGTVIGAVLMVGVVAKSRYDAQKAKNPEKYKTADTTLKQLFKKIDKSPKVTLFAAALLTAVAVATFPVGTIVAGVVAAGFGAKCYKDAEKEKIKAEQMEVRRAEGRAQAARESGDRAKGKELQQDLSSPSPSPSPSAPRRLSSSGQSRGQG